MLDEAEYDRVWRLYGECMHSLRDQMRGERGGEARIDINARFAPVRAEYARMTGMVDCHHNAIMHHRMSIYGPPCAQCGKPLRTPKARFCAACGKVVTQDRQEP